MAYNETVFTQQRQHMVQDQLAGRGITDQRVLEAFTKVPRHKFVPEKYIKEAYADHPVPLSLGQTISQPYIVALMTQLLELTGNERVLEIGTGSGYQTAILAELAKEVYSIERFPELAENARSLLERLGYKNIRIQPADGTLGWQQEAEFDKIIITAAANHIPQPLVEQLKDQGLLVIPIGDKFSQILTLGRKSQGALETRSICGCVFVPLIGEQ